VEILGDLMEPEVKMLKLNDFDFDFKHFMSNQYLVSNKRHDDLRSDLMKEQVDDFKILLKLLLSFNDGNFKHFSDLQGLNHHFLISPH
jgi:hypothetical protein